MATEVMIDTRRLRYTGEALAALKGSSVDANFKPHGGCEDSTAPVENVLGNMQQVSPERTWLKSKQQARPPQPSRRRHNGIYPLTTEIAPWVKNALANYQPSSEVLGIVKPFAAKFHDLLERERESSSGLHDLDLIELTFQCTLEISAAILLAADTTDDPISLSVQYHTSGAEGDDHFSPWGRLLTGLECDPPIIAQFPFYLLMCQSFTFEPTSHREDYVYSALTGIDWVKGNNKFKDRVEAFEKLAWASVPDLDDTKSGGDRSFWRIALAYLLAINDCENVKPFKIPRKAPILHDLDHDLVIAARAFDTSASAYMCRDGAAYLDDEGMDSILGSAVPNDIMDLHVDILTGETRNLLRLLYPPSDDITRCMQTTSTILSSMICEIFRGHHRARMHNREDGRVSSTSPAYSFCRARHRRIFETMELYINKYPQFWEWTWEIYRMAKSQVTEAGIAEPLICGLKRAGTQSQLPESPANRFFELWYDMVEDGSAQLAKKNPLGASTDLAAVVRDIHSLWHQQLLDDTKKPGWGREFDRKSDMLLGEAGRILENRGDITEDTYKFMIAYGRLSMGLPYIAYHTIDAIIMAFGAIYPA
ncbi:hypothetical protein F4774DRAFT_427499 [Daldinia eschscholtzii]|nr:hypothetical protein F4774DRAFT_427499 [Daldinia eschscholtzii]